METSLDVSIVLPCLNEEVTLPLCIERAMALLAELRSTRGYSGEIVVADNGSTDRSVAIAGELGARVVRIKERGYGNALTGGFASAKGRILVMGDADGSYDFREAGPLVDKVAGGDDVCLGSRIKGRILPGSMPWKNRWIGNPLLTGVLNVFFDAGVSDAHCGMRALRKSAFERLRLNSPGMEFASEMVVKAALLGLRISEVPITLHPDGRGRLPHLRPWRDGWRHLRYLFMLSPTWLFFIPAAFLGTIGLTVFLALLSQPERQMVEVFGLRFGDHWMILAGGLLTVAHQLAALGTAGVLYGLREGFRAPKPWHAVILRAARLEFLLLLSVALIAASGVIFYQVLDSWAQSGFGALSALREMVAATTLLALGIQTGFAGFLLAIVAGNEARPALSIFDTSA
jgi:glycosyltransferase involved in cell wall biosynthesis